MSGKTGSLPCRERFPTGSYLSRLYASPKHRRHDDGGVTVRVVDYRLEGVPEAEPLYRLVTTLLDPADAPAAELAAMYHERWESEGAFAELKVSLPGQRLIAGRIWPSRNSTACCWRISPCGISSMTPASRPAATPTRCP